MSSAFRFGCGDMQPLPSQLARGYFDVRTVAVGFLPVDQPVWLRPTAEVGHMGMWEQRCWIAELAFPEHSCLLIWRYVFSLAKPV